MHNSVRTFIRQQVQGHAPFESVVEIGSRNVNGNVRDIVPHTEWLGIDAQPGDGVDMVCDAHDVPIGGNIADLVLCLEMLEHDSEPNATFATIARMVRKNGTILITTRSEGFPRHCPPDFWRYTADNLHALAYTAGLDVLCVEDDPEAPGVFAALAHG